MLLLVPVLLQLLMPACNRPSLSPAAARMAAEPEDLFPRILTVSPATVPFSDNQATIGSLHVKYRIKTPEAVETAYLELRIGTVQIVAQDVPVMSEGEADLKVDRTMEIGPTVELRVHCPNGDSNWLAIGGAQPSPSSAQPRIENIAPESINKPDRNIVLNGNLDALVEFNLWGAGFSDDCTAAYRVNGGEPADVERSIYWGRQQFIVYITRRPLAPATWTSPRYFQLALVTLDKNKIEGRLPAAKEDLRAIPVGAP